MPQGQSVVEKHSGRCAENGSNIVLRLYEEIEFGFRKKTKIHTRYSKVMHCYGSSQSVPSMPSASMLEPSMRLSSMNLPWRSSRLKSISGNVSSNIS
jgi:hypothetical protein